MAPREAIGSSSSFLELKPHQTSLLDLVRVLFSSHHSLARRNFVDTSNASHLEGLELRWIIFLSLLAQKTLLHLKKPMAWMGFAIELWLNLLMSNGGFCRLLINILKGSVVRPHKSSEKFVSVLGFVDPRVDLDEGIKTTDDRYGAALSIMASKLAYEYEPFAKRVVTENWKMEMVGWFNFWNDFQHQKTTHALVFKDTTSNPNIIVVAFRGTEPFDADQWRTDVDYSWYELDGVGRIHSGFMKALGAQKEKGWPKDIIDGGTGREYAYYTLRQMLKDELEKDKNVKFIVTGHSLGAALAILFVAGLVLHEEEELLESLDWVYTYGQPRVGNEQFGNWMGEKMRTHDVKYLRYVYSNDLVPRVPYDDRGGSLYKHFGPCLWVNGFYQGKVVWEEPDKNYFSPLWLIPKVLNAVLELIRSFILPYIYGPVYKESSFMKLTRVFGLFIPGLAAHCPQDYDNATRLGSFPPEILVQQVLNGKKD